MPDPSAASAAAHPDATRAAAPRLSVLIPNWDGGERLLACVASLRRECAAAHAAGLLRADGRGGWEIVVVDDAGPTGPADLALLRERFADDEGAERLVLRQRPENGGFGATVNEAASLSRGAFLLLANNDLLAQRGFVEELLRPFDLPGGEKLAAVSARTEALDGSANHVAMDGRWIDGRIQTAWADPPPEIEPPATAAGYRAVDFFQGGSALIRRAAWDEAGGLDEAFSPGYWEDYDLSARFAANGWSVLYAPRARAFHVGKASMAKKHTPGGARDMAEAHRLLFELRHRPEGVSALDHAKAVARDVAREFRGNGPFHVTKGLLRALKKKL